MSARQNFTVGIVGPSMDTGGALYQLCYADAIASVLRSHSNAHFLVDDSEVGRAAAATLAAERVTVLVPPLGKSGPNVVVVDGVTSDVDIAREIGRRCNALITFLPGVLSNLGPLAALDQREALKVPMLHQLALPEDVERRIGSHYRAAVGESLRERYAGLLEPEKPVAAPVSEPKKLKRRRIEPVAEDEEEEQQEDDDDDDDDDDDESDDDDDDSEYKDGSAEEDEPNKQNNESEDDGTEEAQREVATNSRIKPANKTRRIGANLRRALFESVEGRSVVSVPFNDPLRKTPIMEEPEISARVDRLSDLEREIFDGLAETACENWVRSTWFHKIWENVKRIADMGSPASSARLKDLAGAAYGGIVERLTGHFPDDLAAHQKCYLCKAKDVNPRNGVALIVHDVHSRHGRNLGFGSHCGERVLRVVHLYSMLHFIRGQSFDRQMRLFYVACISRELDAVTECAELANGDHRYWTPSSVNIGANTSSVPVWNVIKPCD